MYVYKAFITKVYDGDTVTATVDLGFNVCIKESLRLGRIDAPEIRGEERERGLISRDWLRALILNKEVIVKTYKDKTGKYGRYIADIFVDQDGEMRNVNDWLVKEGLAEYREY